MNSRRFLKYFAKFRENSMRIGAKFDENCRKIANFCRNFSKNAKMSDDFLLRFSVSSGAKVWYSCRSRKMLKNDYLLAKIGADTAENEPPKVWLFCWEIWIRYGTVPSTLGRCRAASGRGAAAGRPAAARLGGVPEKDGAALVVAARAHPGGEVQPKVKDTVPYLIQISQPNSQTLLGLFFVVSAPNFAS